MKALEDKENVSQTKQNKSPSQKIQERSGINVDATPFVLREFTTPLKFEQPRLPTSEVPLLYTTIRATLNAYQVRS